MIRSNRFAVAAAALIGLCFTHAYSLGPAPSPKERVIAPKDWQGIPNPGKRRLASTGEGYSPSHRWPYNGKNRAQRMALRGAFIAILR